MKVSDAFPSEYFRAADVSGDGIALTIRSVQTEEMMDGKRRRCIEFEEIDKRLIVNKTNFLKIADVLKEDNDDRWIGRRIRLVRDRVPFKGDLVAAIRVTAAPNGLQ